MGEPVMEREGLLRSVMRGTPFEALGITPKMIDRDLTIEIDVNQLAALLFQGMDERARRAVSLELHEGKMVLRLRLW
jgi:hypothetical protein